MLTKRIIPCLDIRDGKVVKGQKFEGIREVADPVELAGFYSAEGADELVFYDITASVEGRSLFVDLMQKVAAQISIPLMVGGGVATVEDVQRMLDAGADTVSINSGVIRNPDLIAQAARKVGGQRIALSMDVKKVEGQYRVFARGGMEDTGIDALEWARRGQENGAGELVVNSIETDGVKGGFDLELLGAMAQAVDLPIVASGGAGSIQHFVELFQTLPQIDAGLAASVFHFREVQIGALKEALKEQGIPVRIER